MLVTLFQHYLVLIVSCTSVVIAFLNIFHFMRPKGLAELNIGMSESGLISILIPARNEEDRIGLCLEALRNQTYEPLEILILDDNSTDRTGEIVNEHVSSDSRVRLISGKETPDGWVGKNWACHQLSGEALGKYILFIDADTILSRDTVQISLVNSKQCDADLLTMMPRRIAGCFVERLLYPFVDWAIFCWIPFGAARRLKSPFLSASFGQFLLFKKASYQFLGGHLAISANPLDDFELGRATKKNGLTWALYDGVQLIEVLPYSGNMAAIKGISRSVFPAMNYRFTILTALSLVCLALVAVPTVNLVLAVAVYSERAHYTVVACVSIGMIALSWLVVCRRFHHNTLSVPFYWVSILLIVFVAWHSAVSYSMGLTKWRGRTLGKPKVRF